VEWVVTRIWGIHGIPVALRVVALDFPEEFLLLFRLDALADDADFVCRDDADERLEQVTLQAADTAVGLDETAIQFQHVNRQALHDAE